MKAIEIIYPNARSTSAPKIQCNTSHVFQLIFLHFYNCCLSFYLVHRSQINICQKLILRTHWGGHYFAFNRFLRNSRTRFYSENDEKKVAHDPNRPEITFESDGRQTHMSLKIVNLRTSPSVRNVKKWQQVCRILFKVSEHRCSWRR